MPIYLILWNSFEICLPAVGRNFEIWHLSFY
jgi:hypothetical protein